MKKTTKTAFDEIELGLGGLLGELGTALTEALKRLDGQGEVQHETTFDSPRGPVRASTGIRIRTLGGAARSAGGRRTDAPINSPGAGPQQAPEAKAPATSEIPARDIVATILTDATGWRLIADLPGVVAGDVVLSEEGGEIVIRAEGRGRRYMGRFALPTGAAAKDLVLTVQNGILELAWQVDA